jgi:hypothetical protein
MGSPDGSADKGSRDGYKLRDNTDGTLTRCKLVTQRQTYAKLSISRIALWLQAWRQRFAANPSNAGWLRKDKRTPNYRSFGLCYGYKLGYRRGFRQRPHDDTEINTEC